MLFLNPIVPNDSVQFNWSGIHDAALGLAISEAAQSHGGTIVVVHDNQRQLDILEEEIRFFLPAKESIPLYQFPAWECLPYDNFSPSKEITSNRLRQLSQFLNNTDSKAQIILIHASNLMQKLPPKNYILSHGFYLFQGQTLDLDELKKRLIDTYYLAVNQVSSPGEFAIRGGMIDLFPMGSCKPYRLDLFDNEVDTLRSFDVDSQRSIEKVEKIELLPAREFPMSEQAIKLFRSNFRKQFEGDPKKQPIYNHVSQANIITGIEFYFPLFFNEIGSFFDYIPKNSCFIYPQSISDHFKTYWAEIDDRYQNANYIYESKVLPPDCLYLSADILENKIKQYPRIATSTVKSEKWQANCSPAKSYPVDSKHSSPYQRLITHLKTVDYPVFLLSDTRTRQDAFDLMLIQHQIKPIKSKNFEYFSQQKDSGVFTGLGKIQRGLKLEQPQLEIICENQLYGEKVFQRRRRSHISRDPDLIIKSLAELSIDDPVVHIEHGIGRYNGLQILDIQGDKTEYLTISYQGDDKLYVPITSLNLVSRFLGGSAESAPLHRLGSNQWNKVKKQAQKKAYDAAVDLLEVEAYRSVRPGHAFSINNNDLKKFSDGFAFEETPDQYHAIGAVIKDLSSSNPMDHLVCGDVGFGKTEVAMRAAFVVAIAEKQVAVLTPTTLLAQQHYQTFLDRFENWPINIGLLSRFNSTKETREVIGKVKKGLLDIVIGTHKLLQDSVKFNDLGLLIIDEEHRFGVRQKERLKKLRSQVDVLTLTATPIPRTLNFAMSGLRDISVIGTPPVNRLSIKTFIQESNNELIKEACIREIRRGGQVYFLHNDVKSIDRVAAEISTLVPEAEVNVCHGQMRELQLERIMRDFYHRRFNILVCTTIIESGIDISSANTIIINRADKFGLAQLHQLRGRVGRSSHQAFAYLLLPENSPISGDARKRLDAISSMEDLGAGFLLASHDMEIRGAGELLGETQSGAIDEIGFSLYSEYLNQAISAIKKGQITPSNTDDNSEKMTIVDLHLTAIFPHDYLPNTHTRLILYKRIASAIDRNQLEELQIEVVDRFGLLPDEVKNLFLVTEIRLQSEELGIKKIDFSETGGVFEFFENPNIELNSLLNLIQVSPSTYRLEQPLTLRVMGNYGEGKDRLHAVKKVLDTLNL